MNPRRNKDILRLRIILKKKEELVRESNEEKGPLDPATKVIGLVDPNWKTSNARRRAAYKVREQKLLEN